MLGKLMRSQERFSNWTVASAGTWAVDGQPASSRARRVLLERGVDLSDHRSRSVTRALLQAADLVLTMEHGHKEALVAEFPDLSGRIWLLAQLAGSERDIIDPMGGEMADFEETAREIEKILQSAQDQIYSLAAQNSRA